MHKILKTTSILALTVAVSACSIFESKGPKQKYNDEGKERLSILSDVTSIQADPSIASVPVVLPAPYTNKNWAQPGGAPSHVLHHLAAPETLSKAWTASMKASNSKYERVIASPVAGGGKVFSVDAKGTVYGFSLQNGSRLWSYDITIDEKVKMGYGGGVTYADGVVYATSGFGIMVALDADSGRELWTFKYTVPFRGAPTVAENKVFATTHDNLMVAVDVKTGAFVWDQVGIMESAGMLGSASPAYHDGSLIFALSSGEMIARRAANGLTLWQDTLKSSRRLTPLATLTDIDAHPVIDRGRAYGVSHSGRMVSIDMRSGERVWEADIAGVNTPWIAGNFAFVTTVDAQIICLSLADGRIRWVQQLQRFEDQEKRRDLIKWNGPLLAGNRLFVTSSHGYMLTLSPYDGDVISGVNVKDGMTTSPIIVDGTLITLTDTGKLIAYR